MLALFRLVEAAEGRILIDDVDISKISLDALRKALSIIPQDPVLWSCSIKDNLDPFNKYSDAEVWDSLEKVGLKEVISNEKEYPAGLSHTVSEGGSNFSVGQRQLFCIARALLRNSKVLLLDEATASIDRDTDRFIQEMIRKSFQHCTVLVIAHRLNTIADFDRIMVLDDGRVAEFDTPLTLIDDEESIFGNMVRATGEESASLLRQIAAGEQSILSVDLADLVADGSVPGGSNATGLVALPSENNLEPSVSECDAQSGNGDAAELVAPEEEKEITEDDLVDVPI
jgi:ABC-type multidrug transport system fused ATPase/permease subunit